MNLSEYQTHHSLTDAHITCMLNTARPHVDDPPVFMHRLKRLKEGKTPTKLERYLLDVATDGECTVYN